MPKIPNGPANNNASQQRASDPRKKHFVETSRERSVDKTGARKNEQQTNLPSVRSPNSTRPITNYLDFKKHGNPTNILNVNQNNTSQNDPKNMNKS